MYRPYPEFEKGGEFSPSSFVSGIKDRLQGFFQSKEKKRAGARVEGFHAAKKKNWDQFLNHASRKSFVKQLGSDSRSDAKLVMHADNMNRLQTGKKIGTVQGGSKSYSIVKLRGKDRLGCTCNDWRYKRSVAKPGEAVDCKHIRRFKQMNKTAASALRSRIRVVKDSMPGNAGDYRVLLEGRQIGKVPVSPTTSGRVGIDMGTELSKELRGLRIYPKVLGEILKQEGGVDSGGVLSGSAYSAWRRFAENNPSAAVENAAAVVRENRPARQLRSGRIRRVSVPSTGEPVFKATLPATWKTKQMNKTAGHVEDRIAERSPGATYEVAKIRARIPMMNLRKGQTYHVPLKGGKGYAVIGDIGPKHVVKTVLGPNMKPPGERTKVASARGRRKKRAQAQRDAALIVGGGYLAPRALGAASAVGMAPYMIGSPLSVDKEELLRTVEEHGLRGARDEKKTVFGIPYNRNAAYDPNTHEILGDLDRYSKSVLYHEIGHGVDKDLIQRMVGERPGLKSTLSMLRNEAVANINALKLRPGVLGKIDQAVFTVPQMAGYIGGAGARHPLISTGLSAGALYGGRALKERKKQKSKKATKTARAPRDYSREYAQYHAKPEQVANRSMRNQARRKLGLKKGDPREVDHKTPISKGGGNGKSNLSAVSRSYNRRKFNGS